MHCILLDAAKAFDRVDHTALLRILQSIGLDTVSLKWFFSHLSGRCIRTKVNSHTSSSSPITSGVPQGSVLGTLLFLIYYKDIPTVTAAMTALFADGTLLFHPACHGSKNSPCCLLQADLDALAADLNVSFNPLKSVYFFLGPHPSQEVLQVHGVAIPRRKEARHLGVCLTSDLRWNSHVSHLILQSASPIHLCQKLGYQQRLSSSVIRRFFIAFVRPKLECFSAVWCGLPRSQAIRLENSKLQLKVAKTIVRRRDLSHPQVLRAAELPTLSWRRRDHCLSALWNLKKGIGPPALLDALPALTSIRSVPALHAGHSLQFPLCSSSRHQSSFLCHSIPLWNNLPSSVVSSSSLVLFQRSVRDHFAADKYLYGLS